MNMNFQNNPNFQGLKTLDDSRKKNGNSFLASMQRRLASKVMDVLNML